MPWITVNGNHILIEDDSYASPRKQNGHRVGTSDEYRYHNKHPVTKKPQHHDGVDIPASKGTSIPSIVDGKVLNSGTMIGYGKYVDITGSDGRIRRYAHLNSTHLRENHDVKAGDEIGKVGNTGIGTGDHLHYEVGKIGKGYNPKDLSKLQHKSPPDKEVDFYARVLKSK